MFKKGSVYSRKDIGWIYFPDKGRPKGGAWDTGYVRVGSDLIVFMNIGVPGRTEHDFANHYDEANQTIVWYGKPKSHSNQPTFKKLISGEYTPHFFARWDNKNPDFTYLGIGKIVTYTDGTPTLDGNGNPAETIEVILTCQDVEEIIPRSKTDKPSTTSFALEKHLEDFIVRNWSNTILNEKYDIYEQDGKMVGRQFQTGTGPLDILAISKDKSEYLVVELKRDRASDVVVGQTKRYMGWVKREIAKDGQDVRGCIIALQDDPNLKDALYASPDIDFMRYEVKFDLVLSEKT
jgi:hypothetical protein